MDNLGDPLVVPAALTACQGLPYGDRVFHHEHRTRIERSMCKAGARRNRLLSGKCMSLSSNQILRRLTSLFAAIALVNVVAARSAFACERAHGMQAHVVSADVAGHHDSNGGTDCTEPMPPAGEHNADCLAKCLSMAGCSTPCFVSELAQSLSVTRDNATPSNLTQSHPTRSLAPDRPPPRS